MSSQPTGKKWLNRHAVALLCVLAAAIAIHSIDSDRSSLILGGLRNAGHLPLFGVLSLIVFTILKGNARPYLGTVAVCLVIALISEMTQSLTGGNVDWRDGLADGIGISLFLAARWLWVRRTPVRAILAIVLVLSSMLPAMFWSTQWLLRRADAPCLLTERWPLRRPVTQAFASVAAQNRTGESTLALTLERRRYAGLRLHDPIADWSAADALVIRAHAAPGSEGTLTVRIHDRAHNNEHSDRFNQTLQLTAVSRTLRIPLDAIRLAPAGRDMDMTDIAQMSLFRVNAREGDVLFIDSICLQPSSTQ